MKQITHSFFPLGATLYKLPDYTLVFIHPSEDSLNAWMAWYTGIELKDKEINAFLDECAEGQHSTLGSGFNDTWQEIMAQLNDFMNP